MPKLRPKGLPSVVKFFKFRRFKVGFSGDNAVDVVVAVENLHFCGGGGGIKNGGGDGGGEAQNYWQF